MTTKPMYAAIANSPETELATAISEKDTEITVLSTSGLPAPPNLLTVGLDETAETVRYVKIDGNKLTVERGFQGQAKSWSQGTKIARHYTAYDHDAFMMNIQGLSTEVSEAHTELAKVNQRHKVCEDNGTTIQISEQDLNTITKTGFYTGKKMVNGPASWGEVWMYIEVVAHSPTNVLQKAYHLFHNTTCYIRRKPYEGTDWTAWEAYAMDKDVEALRKTVAEVKAASLPLTGGTVKGLLQTTGHFTCGGFDFNLGTADQATRGDSGPSRAMAKLIGNVLAVNYAGDFKGGIHLQGSKTQVDGTLMVGGKDVAKELAAIGQRHKVCDDDGMALDKTGSDIDLDDIVKTGFYRIGKPKNAPALNISGNMLVVVAYDSQNVSQTIHTYDKKYIRRKRSAWTPWIAMATEKDIDGVKQLATEAKAKAEKDIQTLGQKVSEAKEQANTAAKQAETNAKAHTDTKLAEVNQRHRVCNSDGTAIGYHKKDVNTLTKTGFYSLTNPINAPALKSSVAYMVVIHCGLTSPKTLLQKLYDYGADKAYIRRFTGGWTPWVAMATEKDIAEVDKKLAEVKQSGVELKKKLADAINANTEGFKVSASEEFSALIALAGRIISGGERIRVEYYSSSSNTESVIAVFPPGIRFAKITPNSTRYPKIGAQVTWENPQDTVTNAASLRTGYPTPKLVLKDSSHNTVDIYTGPSALTFHEGEYASADFPLKEFELSPKLYPKLNFDKETKLVAQLPRPPSHWRIKNGFSFLFIHGTITYY